MNRKRVLLFSIFFSILAGSLIYYLLPRVFPPRRRDPIPPGAYIVPWMRPSPYFQALWFMREWDIDTIMADALELNISFNISTPNGTRIMPSTVYLGHDTNYLYVGGKFRGMYKNPASGYTTLANYFHILFDVANDGVLTSPESGSRLSVWVNPEADLRNETDDFRYGVISSYEDMVWSYSRLLKRESFRFARDVYDPEAQPAFAVKDYDMGYDKSTGTVTILFSRYLWRSAIARTNALQMRSGERWVMGFLLELGYNTWSEEMQDFVDGWPQEIYPYTSNNASWWPKLVIDLANPPATLSK